MNFLWTIIYNEFLLTKLDSKCFLFFGKILTLIKGKELFCFFDVFLFEKFGNSRINKDYMIGLPVFPTPPSKIIIC